MSAPEISVVMAVYNGSEFLAETLQSILNQEECDLEFIVVNDGSTDASAHMLDDWAARESRMRVVHQENAGLTRALIRGCAEARGEFVARQDVGDVSLRGRLSRQAQRLSNDHACVAVTCHSEFVGPRGEFLLKKEIGEQELNETLVNPDPEVLAGPSHHGSMMMRRSDYEAVGGYRKAFYFAQDLDLWTRLIERGRFGVVPELLYRARLEAGSISGRQAEEQRRLCRIISRPVRLDAQGKTKDLSSKRLQKFDRRKRVIRDADWHKGTISLEVAFGTVYPVWLNIISELPRGRILRIGGPGYVMRSARYAPHLKCIPTLEAVLNCSKNQFVSH